MNIKDAQDRMDELLNITKQAFETFLMQADSALKASRPLPLAVDEDAADPAALALDMSLVAAAPVLAVPAHAPFAPLKENGHRFLLASDGLHLEVLRPWLHYVHRLGEAPAVRIPYGAVEERALLAFGRLGTALPQMKEFAAHACEKAPFEAAASLIWNDIDETWSIKYPEVIGTASTSHIQYKQVDLAENESIAIDLHSHGHHTAFFSETDDVDDAGTVKISGVLGDLDKENPTAVFRLCVLGIYTVIPVPAAMIFG